MARWIGEEGLWLDCTGLGEIQLAVSANVSRRHILIHGVNKTHEVLHRAIEASGRVVVDNLTELSRLCELRKGREEFPEIWLRLRPGVVVNTHAYTQTGQEDSKFGMSEQEIMQPWIFAG
jgi:diaminopimelate decarboxylase